MAKTDRALREVRQRTVAWDPDLGCEGGFRWADGRRIDNYPLLMELWAAKLNGLVHVDGGVVLPSTPGGGS
jgi:hypothetical protein